MNPILFVRTAFLAGAGVGVIFDTSSYLRSRFVSYGPRTKQTRQTPSQLSFLDSIFAYPVPHHWFLHYYILTVSLSLFWGYQLLTRGSVVSWLASSSMQNIDDSMTLERVYLAWFLLLAQGARRLYESIASLKRSQSTMALAMYIIGIVYYLLDSVGIWIEGSATILASEPLSWTLLAQRARFGVTPSWRVMLCLPIFMVASGLQHDAHRYLASLKKYMLPQHPIFGSVICPHYLMECAIYLSLALAAAPKGQMVNKTIFTTFIFTTVNLGIVAKSAKEWSVEKFGVEAEGRWRMVPYVW